MSEAIESIDLGPYSIEQLNALIERTKKEIAYKERIRVQEVRNQIHKLASDLNMTVEDLLKLDLKKKKSAKPVGKIKYRNPANPSQTWTGRGKQPNWLKEAMEKGASKEEFAI
jgi:DNA-binding protein H-NS